MLFTSIDFAFFLSIVFLIYWFAVNRSLNFQSASYSFYGWWDWRFLFLLFFVSASNYLVGLLIDGYSPRRKRKLFLLAGLFINIRILVP